MDYNNRMSGLRSSGVAKGEDDGGGPPRAALFGGGKIEVIPKNKKFLGVQNEGKKGGCAKKGRQKILGY